MNEPGNAGTTSRMGENRRLYPRRKIERLAYVDFGPDNGGMLDRHQRGRAEFPGSGTRDPRTAAAPAIHTSRRR